MENVLILLGGALALMGSPGPATLASAGLGAAYPTAIALRTVLAITAGTTTVIMAVALGVTGLILSLPGAVPVLGIAAAGYMIWLAWKIANAAPLGASEASVAPSPLGLYLMAIANPKAYAAFAALFSGFPLTGDAATDVWLKAGGLPFIALIVNVTWMIAGRRLARSFSDPAQARWLNRAFAATLLASIAAAFLV